MQPIFPLPPILRPCRHLLCAAALLLPVGAGAAPPAPSTPATLPAPLPAPLTEALRGAGIAPRDIALFVQRVDAPGPLLAHQADRAFNPASAMKLLTTYAGLELLGPAHRWQTQALADAAPENGRLAGNLYLRGSGDPKFALEQFWLLLRQLRARGVGEIAGDLVLDRSAFDVPPHDPGAFDNEPLRPYNAGPDALLVNLNSLRLTLLADTARVTVIPETPAAGLHIANRLSLDDEACGDWREKLRITVNGNGIELDGRFSAACGEKALHLAPWSPDRQVEGLFRALWSELGGTLQGRVRGGLAPATARPLATHESPPLADVVRDINKFSNNVMARQLFLSLDATRPATAAGAQRRIAGWLAEKGLRLPGLVLDNGAGLSRSERIDARGLGEVLLAAWRSPVMPELMASLPVAGVDGTMQKRLGDSPANGRAHVKTGYLEGVRAIAGYVLDAGGRRWVVVCLINGPRAREGKPAMDALLRWVAGLRPAADDAR